MPFRPARRQRLLQRAGLATVVGAVDLLEVRPIGRSRLTLDEHIREGVIEDDTRAHRTPPGAPRSPRAARFRMSALTSDVQGAASSLLTTVFASRPRWGDSMTTMSPSWWVKPMPCSPRSIAGANDVPVNSTNPSGYWWWRPQVAANSSGSGRLMS